MFMATQSNADSWSLSVDPAAVHSRVLGLSPAWGFLEWE